MDAKAWNLEDRWAKLRLGKLAATVDLLEPAPGCTSCGSTAPWHAARLLEVGIGAATATQLDAYVRERDLVVTYEQTDARPFRATSLFAGGLVRGHGALAAIELVLSVQTSLWDSDPGLTVGSIVPGGECLRLVKVEEQLVERLSPVAGQGQSGGTSGPCRSRRWSSRSMAPAASCFAHAQTDVTYIEMVHPVDFSCSLLNAMPHGLEKHLEIRHRLFVQRLEKGVILRARVRSAFVPRHDDVAAAAPHCIGSSPRPNPR